jgi:hypothetical protein
MHRQLAQDEISEEGGKPQILAPGEIVIGVLAGIDPHGRPLVTFSGSVPEQPLVALSTVGVNRDHVGRQVALLFAHGNPEQPVIMGLVHSPLYELLANFENAAADRTAVPAPSATDAPAENAVDATIDGQRVVLEGKEEIVLKCGDASITLTKAGKILIRGKYLQSRSAGINRIMGGSVQIN